MRTTRRTIATAAATIGIALSGAATAAAVEQSTVTPPTSTAPAAEPGWHAVDEPWQPYPEGDLTLPAARYCGSFDLSLTAVRQDIKVKVLSRWDDGTARSETYSGQLISRATNLSSGSSTDLNFSGTAQTLYRPDGSLSVYTMRGPVGMGWPAGGGSELGQGFYQLNGYHEVEFGTDGVRRMLVDRGEEVNVCQLVD